MDPNAHKKNLVNKFNKEEAIKKLKKEKFSRLVVSFYFFRKISNISSLRDAMFLKFNDLNIKGRIYISREGVNAQASVPKQNKLEFENYVKEIFDYKLLRFNYAITHN